MDPDTGPSRCLAGRLSVPGTLRIRLIPQVHLQEGEAHFHPLLELLGESPLVRHRRRVGIQADAVAVLAAQHLVDGDAVRLARQVPQGHFDAGDAAALPAVVAELPNRLKILSTLQGFSPSSRLLSIRA